MERRQLSITGQVQGVGFRPFVHQLAARLGVAGSIRNDGDGVGIDCRAAAEVLDRFERAIAEQAPPLARIEAFASRRIPLDPAAPDPGPALAPGDARAEARAPAFVIEPSRRAGPPRVGVTPDAAVCPACLAELRDPAERRHAYGLTNCTHCGPRYSIATGIPWDRPQTTMVGFPMCPDCAREYGDLANRRYHAQPIACPVCGPRVRLYDGRGEPIPGDPYAAAARLLAAGRILAVKGLGGYHLACRADDPTALRRLREAKQREAKPLALLVADLDRARALCRISPAGADALASPARPILLAETRIESKGSAAPAVAPEVAPGTHRLGLMLPATPIQVLLLDALDALGLAAALVMTSGNRSGEPLAIDEPEAFERLGGMADAFLVHDRPIARPVDDSVLIDLPAGPPMPVRWARGYAPGGVRLAWATEAPPGLAFGGDLKGGLALLRPGGQVVLGQHLGDLENASAQANARRVARDLLALFEVEPRWIACDPHPAYFSSRLAREMAADRGLPLIEVQHHQAHAAALLAEAGHRAPALALVADGVGYGTDGRAWGGELLALDGADARRLGHLAPLRLPGGDAAARHPARSGLSLLARVHGPGYAERPLARRLIPDDADRAMLVAMLDRDLRCPPSTALGRLFDALAAWLGLCLESRFEAQAPMALEAAARGEPAREAWPMGLVRTAAEGWLLDPLPLAERLLVDLEAGRPMPELAARIHDGLVEGLARLALAGTAETGLRTVALSGGVFCNARLTLALQARLEAAGLRVLRHARLPTTDGGLALGQAAVAAARLLAQDPGQDPGRGPDRSELRVPTVGLEALGDRVTPHPIGALPSPRPRSI